jgi:hypothetical protein
LPDSEQDELRTLIADFLATTSFDEDVPPETYFEELREWAEEDD